MRPFLVLFVLACALGALAWTLRESGPKPDRLDPGGPLTTPAGAPPVDPLTAPVDDSLATGTTLEAVPPQYVPRVPDVEPPPPLRGDPVELAGDVYIELEGGALLPGVNGHVRLRQLAGGALEELVVPVAAGRFTCTVPDRALLTLLDGVLNGEEVRFAQPAKPFEPRADRMALIGKPRPNCTLRVLVAGTGADLTDVTVREVDGPGGAHLVAGPLRGPRTEPGEARPSPPAPLASGASSPLRLPWVDTRRPLWLEVSAPGFAPARALVDPRAASTRTFELQPAGGTLTVHVTGPGRGRVEGLVVQRLEAEDKRPIAAHFNSAPLGEQAPDPLVYDLEGLAAARHLVRVTFLDRAYAGGAVRDLASGEVDLPAGASARLVLFVPGP